MEVVHNGMGGVIDLAENIIRAFKDPSLFKEYEPGCGHGYYVASYDLPFEIDKYLIDFNQFSNCNWDAINYVKEHADVRIYAGDKDSFGWLVGVIAPNKLPEWTKGKSVEIVYG